MLDEQIYNNIVEDASWRLREATRGIGGQHLVISHNLDYWVAVVTWERAQTREREWAVAVCDKYAAENQRFSDEIERLREVISSALDDLEHNDEPGCLAILKTAVRQMPTKERE